LDAAERRIRVAGYNGFSFRDLAADVGIKSASIHYHFPTKAALAAAVARRYGERFMEAIEAEQATGVACKQAWRAVFRRSLREDGCMCLCGVLGAEADALPSEVATEVRSFFKLGMESLTRAIGKSGQMTPEEAAHMLATLEGAMLLALTLGDVAFFDKATASLA
jgi:TetR/AcrR family transcriptional repressor of nem operon